MAILFQRLDVIAYRVLDFKEIRNKNNVIIRDNTEGEKSKNLNMNIRVIFPSRIFFLDPWRYLFCFMAGKR